MFWWMLWVSRWCSLSFGCCYSDLLQVSRPETPNLPMCPPSRPKSEARRDTRDRCWNQASHFWCSCTTLWVIHTWVQNSTCTPHSYETSPFDGPKCVFITHTHTHTHTYVYTYSTRYHSRRKFRSQTSDSMDRWKSTGGKSQRREEKKREDQRRERVRRKKIQVCEKIGKLQNTVFFQWFVAPEGQKVGSLTSQNVQHTHTHHARTTFGSWDVKKVHAVVVRSTCRSQRRKKLRGTEHFWTFRCRFTWQAQGIVHLVKSEQNVRVLWQFQKKWQAWDICRGSGKMHFA